MTTKQLIKRHTTLQNRIEDFLHSNAKDKLIQDLRELLELERELTVLED